MGSVEERIGAAERLHEPRRASVTLEFGATCAPAVVLHAVVRGRINN